MRWKILISLLLSAVFSAGFARAQETVTYKGSLSDFYEGRETEVSGHLSFQGVEIDGTLEECKQRLRSAKFRYGKVKSEPIMLGKFGKLPIKLQLGTVPGTDLVYVFVVSYSKKSSWMALENQYQSVKMKLTALYGQPSVIDENVERAYVSVISTPKGDITLATEDMCLKIYFVDKANSDIAQAMKSEK